MNHQEAKRILQGYRPGSVDAGDPMFAEARALAATNAELGAWLDREQEFNRALAASEQAGPVPAGLRESILAAAREGATPVARPVWSRPAVWWGVAASVAVLGAIAVARWPRPQEGVADSSLAAFAIADAQHPKTHGGHGDEEAALKSTLKLPTTHLGAPLPVDFGSLAATGCRTLHLDGHDVLEVCFKRNNVGLHCYIARREDFPRLTAANAPQVVDKPLASLAVWADTANLYIVVTNPNRALLEKLL